LSVRQRLISETTEWVSIIERAAEKRTIIKPIIQTLYLPK